MNILLAIAISLLLLFNPRMNAYAAESQTASSDSNNPCSYDYIDTTNPSYAGFDFENPEELQWVIEESQGNTKESPKRTLGGTIKVKYGANKIAGCDVKLRSYDGKLVGPTLRVHPGDRIKLKFINELILDPKNDDLDVSDAQYYEYVDNNNVRHKCEYVEPKDEVESSEKTVVHNKPHYFNITNFHTHGLHVDPKGCSDNALRVMLPRKNDKEKPPEYEIIVDIPKEGLKSYRKDHTSGTFWYHAHLHGSTALQVSSGMAGALIVEPDSPKPADDIALEDIHTLEDIPAIAKAEEKILMLQQILYDDEGKLEDYGDKVKKENSDEKKNKKTLTRRRREVCKDDKVKHQWKCRERRTLINGQVVPVITMRPGELQRWRFIHAGVAESIHLEVRNRTQSREINLNEQIPLHEIAVDGIPLGKLDSWATETIELEPGYRSDVLFKAPIVFSRETTQEYNLIDRASIGKESLSGETEPSRILAKVIVEGDPVEMELPTDIQLVAAKKDAHEDIDPGTIVNDIQKVVYSVHKADPKCTGDKCAYKYTVNDEPFEPGNERPLNLGDAERWDLSVDPKSVGPYHPFHIHVNPFQYVRKGPDGEDETIWRDTLMVRQGYPEEVITKYEDFTGKFVQHCHILHHEDRGMMEILEIVRKPKTS